ncbi:MAG: FKBP-type peptidyl-prolyl cis-trans isomerase [Fluviicola sp.]|nr:FKBP-type peptidyl-prolyl cis-trans isomerase [Fluviicola sp.]
MKILAFLLLSITLVACKTYSEEDKVSFNKEITKIAKQKKWDITFSPSGLGIQLMNEGEGEELIQRGSIVKLSYKGQLKNGKVFDQTEPGKPFESEIKGLIGGFQEALLGQKKGAKLRLIIPPHLGYGTDKLDKIPANSILIFELEVVDFV